MLVYVFKLIFVYLYICGLIIVLKIFCKVCLYYYLKGLFGFFFEISEKFFVGIKVWYKIWVFIIINLDIFLIKYEVFVLE